LPSPAYQDPTYPAPLIETVDDPKAHTVLAFVELRVPVTDPGVYALRWRAGQHSVVRNIHPIATFWDAYAPPAFRPMIRIEASGGGRWYDLNQWHWWNQGPDYRHLLVEGTREPLSFYMLNPESASSDAQIELHEARNISIYSLKAEGLFTTLWMSGCHDVRVYGFGGINTPRPNWPVFRIEDSDDFLLTNLDPELTGVGNSGFWDHSYVDSDPKEWILIGDSPGDSRAPVRLHGVEQVLLYKRGNPRP